MKATLTYHPYTSKPWKITTPDGKRMYFAMLIEAEDWATENNYILD